MINDIMKVKKSNDNYPFERFASIRRNSSFDFFNKDPSWILYVSDINGQFNLWRQRSYLSHEGETYASHQLTNFIDYSIRHVFSSPVDNCAIFFADHHGTENFQIYRIDDIFNSWPQSITNNSNVRYEWGSECFSPNGKYIVYGSNESNPSDMLVYVRNMKSTSEDNFCITEREGWYTPGYWSPDNKRLNCIQLVTLTDYTVWIVDVESRKMEKIALDNNVDKSSRFITGPWHPDGKGFFIISDSNREFAGLAFYDVDKSKLEWIHTPQRDIELVNISPDGTNLFWTENVDGYSNLFIKNLLNEEVKEVTDLSRKGVIEDLKISNNGKKIGLMIDTPTSPTNIFVIDIDNYDENAKSNAITQSLLGNISVDVLIEPQLIKFKSFDGLEISAFLYIPKNNNILNKRTNNSSTYQGSKFGALLSIHGGPTAQERPYYDYSGLYQYLSHKGLVVIAPNFRGSTGYGKSFEKKIYHDWGGKELKDLEYAIKWLLSQDWIDSNRIGVFGASFGGFATLNCITRLPQYNWKVAVDIVGPSNLVTFAQSVPEHWKRFMTELVGNTETEVDFLKERSPITYICNVNPKIKLLVIQGANDPRVAKKESDQIVEKLKENGISVEYMVFEDEGHGFTKYSNSVKALKASAELIVKELS
ncbi:MAG TPA: S9 family peptidase [Nitrososphaeraceae archaeon]|nr:S9 family peptidase [Nitrososphaeraceae archaeon]